jgi:tetratricopeptide (TPR) repeat protein
MRRLLTPSTLVPCLIIAAVIAMVVSANIREGRRSRRPFTTAPALGAAGAPSTTRDGLTGRIAEMESRLASHPDDLRAAVLLADALIRQTRVTGNAGLTVRAEQVLKTALREDPANYDALRMVGSLYLSQHRFSEAVTAAEKCRVMRPEDSVNYGVLGDAHLELGDYDAAFDAFDRMMRLRPGAASYARVAYARELQGNLKGALEAMKFAADASEGGDVEGIAWYHAQVGELYLKMNKPSEAMVEFATASRAFPGHPFAVMGYAKALERIGKHDQARALLADLAAKAPTPDVHARLGDLLVSEGRREDANREYALAEAMWRSDAPEPKNLARFLAERGEKIDEAVAIAETAARARHDIFTEDALAWAYFKAGRTEDARQTIRLALRTGTRDRDILRHAQAIERVPSRVAAR